MKSRVMFVIGLIVVAGLAAPLMGAEGMWMPQQMSQLGAELKTAGLKIDPARLADLTGDPLGAVISIGGCTASFVSPDGLAVTNHHCAFGSLQYNSTKERDLITNGFLAKTRADELPAASGTRFWVTTKIEDVTPRMTAALNAAKGDVDRAVALHRTENALTAECEKPGGVRCKVSSFFEGAQYLRTTQQEISDIRLVYAPSNSIGDFGGETDNFEWPRHAGDFAFLRAYVDGQPYHPPHWLKVSTAGVSEGDFVLVAGYPGRTFRLMTSDEVRNERDFYYPTQIRYLSTVIKIMSDAAKGDRTVAIRNASRIKFFQNSLKDYQSVNEGFAKDRIVESRLAREQAMRAAGNASVLDEIAKLDAEDFKTRERDMIVMWLIGSQSAGSLMARSSPMLTLAYQTYRLAVEREKADAERRAGFQTRDLNGIKQASDRAQKTIDAGSDRAAMRFILEESQKLPASERIKAVDEAIKSAGSIDKLLDRLYGATKIADEGERAKMRTESAAQLRARHDSMLDFAAALTPEVIAGETSDLAYVGAMSRLRPSYVELLRKVSGGTLYPDANGSLRITWGTVEGYTPRDATHYTPQTTVRGILQKDTGEDPFDSPKRLLTAINDPAKTKPWTDPQLGSVAVDFLSTCDTTGGNSGSPTLNAKGELCGLLFDGNYESIDADFLFTPSITRSIHVDINYVLWLMDAVDGAKDLMRELGVEPRV